MTSDVPIVLDNGTGFVKVSKYVSESICSCCRLCRQPTLPSKLDIPTPEGLANVSCLSLAMQAPTSLSMSFPPSSGARFSVQRSV